VQVGSTYPAKEFCSNCGLCDTYYIAHVKDSCAFLGDGEAHPGAHDHLRSYGLCEGFKRRHLWLILCDTPSFFPGHCHRWWLKLAECGADFYGKWHVFIPCTCSSVAASQLQSDICYYTLSSLHQVYLHGSPRSLPNPEGRAAHSCHVSGHL
jgi:hypothetical protein